MMNATCSVANDRRHLVGNDRWEERQVARVVMSRAKPISDRNLSLVRL
jgi:hypothetical protein